MKTGNGVTGRTLAAMRDKAVTDSRENRTPAYGLPRLSGGLVLGARFFASHAEPVLGVILAGAA